MNKELIIRSNSSAVDFALLKDGKLIELNKETDDNKFSVGDILDSLFLYIKHCSVLTEKEKYKIVPLLCKYITIFYDIHEDSIELIFLTNNLLDIF